MFKSLDTNNDGKLVARGIQQVRSQEKTGEAAKATGKKAKKNKAGNKLDTLFAQLDANKDGFLSLDEFKKVKEIKKESSQTRRKKKIPIITPLAAWRDRWPQAVRSFPFDDHLSTVPEIPATPVRKSLPSCIHIFGRRQK